MKIFFKTEGEMKIPRNKKKEEAKKLKKMLLCFSVQDINIPNWTILGLRKIRMNKHPRINNLDYAVYSIEKINSLISLQTLFGNINPNTNYLVGGIKIKGSVFHYLIDLGDFIHISGSYQIYPAKCILIKTKRVAL